MAKRKTKHRTNPYKPTSSNWQFARIAMLEAENSYLCELCVKLIAILKSEEIL